MAGDANNRRQKATDTRKTTTTMAALPVKLIVSTIILRVVVVVVVVVVVAGIPRVVGCGSAATFVTWYHPHSVGGGAQRQRRASSYTTTTTAVLLLPPLFQQQLQRPPFGIEDVTDDRHQDIRTALHRIQRLQTQGELHTRIAAASQDGDGAAAAATAVVKVGISTIPGAGKGLFATQAIEAGRIVAFYPVSAIGVDFGDDCGSVCIAANAKDQQYFDDCFFKEDTDTAEELSSCTSSSSYVHYLIGSRRLGDADFGSYPLFVDTNPNHAISDCEGWLSHYINDGATVAANTREGMLEYYAASRRRKNCVQIPFGPSPLLATVTTRKIAPCEELFTSYGCSYWLDAIVVVSPVEEQRANDEEEPVVLTMADGTDVVAEAVLRQAIRQSAQDIFDAMVLARTAYASLNAALNDSFYR